MNKKDLITIISERADITKVQATAALAATFNSITDALAKDDVVAIQDFGSFKCATAKARTGRNPRTGETIQIPEATRVKFTSGKGLKEAVNNN
jgi:nucleoid DNA-binding protein